jgi:hypothetical protein
MVHSAGATGEAEARRDGVFRLFEVTGGAIRKTPEAIERKGII